MTNYILRRLGLAAITLLLISSNIYALIRTMPGDPLTLEMAEVDPGKLPSKEDLDRMRAAYGLDKPIHEGYLLWLNSVLRGDLQRSFAFKQPVSKLIGERIGPTLILSTTSLVLAYLISIPLGLVQSVRSGKVDERLQSTFLFILYSFPTMVAALFLQIGFSLWLNWLPLSGMVSDDYERLSLGGKAWDIFKHSILPVTCFTYGSLAYYSRFIAANMRDVLRQDYIRTARAKGVGPFRVVVVHAFRNTLIPLVTIIGLSLPGLLSGSVILEQIFTWPGMGRLFFEAISSRDYPIIMGLTLLFSVLTLGGQLLADILYAWVDPRISYH